MFTRYSGVGVGIRGSPKTGRQEISSRHFPMTRLTASFSPFFPPPPLSSSIFLEEELVRSGREEEIDFRRNLFRLFRDLAPVETDRIKERYTRRSFLRSFLHRTGHGAINNSIDYARPGNNHDSNY